MTREEAINILEEDTHQDRGLGQSLVSEEVVTKIIDKIYDDFKKERKQTFIDGWEYGWDNSAEGFNAEYGGIGTEKQMNEDFNRWEDEDEKK